MMDIRIFDLPTPECGLTNRGWLRGATSISLTSKLHAPGWWSMTVPVDAPGATALARGRLLGIDGYYGIIDNISAPTDTSGRRMEVSGYDLKGLTRRRVIMPDESGYAAYNGTTETILKALLSDNLGAAAAADRQMPSVQIAADGQRGISDDKWRGRYVLLDEALSELCDAAGIGYSAIPDLTTGKIKFDVIIGANRTAQQSDRPRIVLATSRRTLIGSGYAYAEADSRNIVYATAGGYEYAEDALTRSYARDDVIPTGYDRREMAGEYSVTGVDGEDKYTELRRLAMAALAEYQPTESMTAEVASGGIYELGRDYMLGDLVTVMDTDIGVTMHAQVTEVSRSYSTSGIKTAVTFGRPHLDVIGRLKRLTRGGY